MDSRLFLLRRRRHDLNLHVVALRQIDPLFSRVSATNRHYRRVRLIGGRDLANVDVDIAHTAVHWDAGIDAKIQQRDVYLLSLRHLDTPRTFS